MTARQASDLFLYDLWPLIVAALMIVGPAYLILSLSRRWGARVVSGTTPLLIALTVLGLTVGYSTSHSREPAVGTVLPALVTLMSAAFTYAVTKEGLSQYRSIMPHCITILAVASLVGLSLGSFTRQRFDVYNKAESLKQLKYERYDLETAKAQYIAQLDVWKQKEIAKIPKAATSASQGAN